MIFAPSSLILLRLRRYRRPHEYNWRSNGCGIVCREGLNLRMVIDFGRCTPAFDLGAPTQRFDVISHAKVISLLGCRRSAEG